jgi:hypothetical protein
VTRAEDLYEELHAHLVLERLGQGDLTDVLGSADPPDADAETPEQDPTPGIAP